MSPPAAVIVADQHPVILCAVKRLLEPQFEVIAMVDNVISLFDALDAHEPDAIVIDTAMYDRESRHVARHVARTHPKTAIVFIGDECDETASLPVVGRCRFVPKSRAADLLRESVAAAILEGSRNAPEPPDSGE